MTGKEINLTIGLMIILSNPNTIPAIAYPFIPPVKLNPATNHEAAYKARPLPNILIIKPIIQVVKVPIIN